MDDAESALNKAAEKFRTSPSISATYILQNDGMTTSGRITAANERFKIESPDIDVWYDGSTQWTFNPETNEVDVTEPTPEELQMINAFAIINSFRNNYKATLQKAPVGKTRVLLTAKQPKARIRKAVLTLDGNSLPTAIELELNDNRKALISIENASVGKAMPADYFKFKQSDHKGVYVNDLR